MCKQSLYVLVVIYIIKTSCTLRFWSSRHPQTISMIHITVVNRAWYFYTNIYITLHYRSLIWIYSLPNNHNTFVLKCGHFDRLISMSSVTPGLNILTWPYLVRVCPAVQQLCCPCADCTGCSWQPYPVCYQRDEEKERTGVQKRWTCSQGTVWDRQKVRKKRDTITKLIKTQI